MVSAGYLTPFRLLLLGCLAGPRYLLEKNIWTPVTLVVNASYALSHFPFYWGALGLGPGVGGLSQNQPASQPSRKSQATHPPTSSCVHARNSDKSTNSQRTDREFWGLYSKKPRNSGQEWENTLRIYIFLENSYKRVEDMHTDPEPKKAHVEKQHDAFVFERSLGLARSVCGLSQSRPASQPANPSHPKKSQATNPATHACSLMSALF